MHIASQKGMNPILAYFSLPHNLLVYILISGRIPVWKLEHLVEICQTQIRLIFCAKSLSLKNRLKSNH